MHVEPTVTSSRCNWRNLLCHNIARLNHEAVQHALFLSHEQLKRDLWNKTDSRYTDHSFTAERLCISMLRCERCWRFKLTSAASSVQASPYWLQPSFPYLGLSVIFSVDLVFFRFIMPNINEARELCRWQCLSLFLHKATLSILALVPVIADKRNHLAAEHVVFGIPE
jgi:hypothetical protein